jgi:ribonuclease HI
MELTAAIEALRELTRPCDVTLYTDSTYLKRGITEWLPRWQASGWRKRGGRAVQNQDLWRSLIQAADVHTVTWRWLRGHRGDPLNERADRLATEARRRMLRQRDTRRPSPSADPRKDASTLPIASIYARGCALGVPGPAGYGALLVRGDQKDLVAGGWPLATSNTMELWSVIAGLKRLERPTRVTLYTGSKYVMDGATRWLANWERRGWRKKDGTPVKNQELWQELSLAMGDHDVRWQYLPASERNAFSAEAAQAARSEATAQRVREAGDTEGH